MQNSADAHCCGADIVSLKPAGVIHRYLLFFSLFGYRMHKNKLCSCTIVLCLPLKIHQIIQQVWAVCENPNQPNNTRLSCSHAQWSALASSILSKTNADRFRHRRTVFLLDAAAQHLEEGCMACPGWHASPDYSALWSSARCSSTPLRACLEHPPAATVFYLRSVHDPVPVHDSLSICIEIKAHSALLTCLIIYTEPQQEVTEMNSFPLYRM